MIPPPVPTYVVVKYAHQISDLKHPGINKGRYFIPFRTAVPFRGQTTDNLSGLSQKRDCSSKRVKDIIVRSPLQDYKSKVQPRIGILLVVI